MTPSSKMKSHRWMAKMVAEKGNGEEMSQGLEGRESIQFCGWKMPQSQLGAQSVHSGPAFHLPTGLDALCLELTSHSTDFALQWWDLSKVPVSQRDQRGITVQKGLYPLRHLGKAHSAELAQTQQMTSRFLVSQRLPSEDFPRGGYRDKGRKACKSLACDLDLSECDFNSFGQDQMGCCLHKDPVPIQVPKIIFMTTYNLCNTHTHTHLLYTAAGPHLRSQAWDHEGLVPEENGIARNSTLLLPAMDQMYTFMNILHVDRNLKQKLI